MAEVASRELRNHTRSLLDRVRGGETITITVDGRPAALLSPPDRRPTYIGAPEFGRLVLDHQADPALGDELSAMAPDTTADVPLP
jgi:prevent-host-death family protein